MIWNFLLEALTFLSAPGKRAALASQAKQILNNRQPDETQPISTQSQQGDRIEKPIMKVDTQDLQKKMARGTASVRSRGSPGREIDTGFPEPLSPDRNTTLRHPDADTSANATIEATSFDLTRTHSKRSVFSRHHSHRSTNSGVLTADQLYDNIEYADGSREKRSRTAIEKEAGMKEDVVPAVPVKDAELGEVEEEKKEEKKEGAQRLSESSASSEDDILRQKGLREGGKKKGLLRKLHLHS